MALTTTSLLNLMLDETLDEDIKQKKLIRTLGQTLKSIFLFIVLFCAVLMIAMIPIWVLELAWNAKYKNIDTSSLWISISMILGSFPLIVISFFQKKSDYSDWSILLHRLLLNNYNLMRLLFSFDQKIYRKKLLNVKNDFVIVTGLARSGTTAFNNILFQTKKFHSLSYANMPFILSPNLWRIIYNPKKASIKERMHGDQMMFGTKSIEALEEYFFKVHLNDQFIKEKVLKEHDIDKDIYEKYLNYQALLASNGNKTMYLAKNNNFMLRFQSLKKLNNQFKVILMFRHPVNHALSLLNQHLRFSKIQEENSFALEYMNWLGHHEFGLNTKTFDFNNSSQITDNHLDLNYWIQVWINYYRSILRMPLDHTVTLISYQDFLSNPKGILSALSVKWSTELTSNDISKFEKQESETVNYKDELIIDALDIYRKLNEMKLVTATA